VSEFGSAITSPANHSQAAARHGDMIAQDGGCHLILHIVEQWAAGPASPIGLPVDRTGR
jgi:hypothetical protein